MMILDTYTIEQLVAAGRAQIIPFDKESLRPTSYALHLSNRFRTWLPSEEPIDAWRDESLVARMASVVEVPAYVLAPKDFVVASTAERISIPREIIGYISNFSHLARLGLSVHLGACWIRPGFGASEPTFLALELFNAGPNPLRLHAGMPICHLRFMQTTGRSSGDLPPKSIYEGRDPLEPPVLGLDIPPDRTGRRSSAQDVETWSS